jgi:hypothetical protein
MSEMNISKYNYKMETIFKILAKIQCIKLLHSVALQYKIPKDIIKTETDNIIKEIESLHIKVITKKHRRTPKQVPLKKDRCCARVYSRNKLISLKGNKLLYGGRCLRKSIKDSNYCKQHNSNLTHGNYLQEPDSYIKKHFLTDYNKLVKKNLINESDIIESALLELKKL